MSEPNVMLVEVDCYECGNRNRKARRACSTCKGSGKVEKYVPFTPIIPAAKSHEYDGPPERVWTEAESSTGGSNDV